MSAPSAGSLTAGSASYSSGTTRAIRPPTPARAMPPSHSRSRSSTVLIPKPFAMRSVATAKVAPAARWRGARSHHGGMSDEDSPGADERLAQKAGAKILSSAPAVSGPRLTLIGAAGIGNDQSLRTLVRGHAAFGRWEDCRECLPRWGRLCETGATSGGPTAALPPDRRRNSSRARADSEPSCLAGFSSSIA